MNQLRHHAVLVHSTGGAYPTLPAALVHCLHAVHALAPQGKVPAGVARQSDAPPDP